MDGWLSLKTSLLYHSCRNECLFISYYRLMNIMYRMGHCFVTSNQTIAHSAALGLACEWTGHGNKTLPL